MTRSSNVITHMYKTIFATALSVALFSASPLAAQTATMTTSGNWGTASNWTGSNIGNTVAETITIDNNVDPTVASGVTFTVGNTTFANNNTLTINSTGTLNIGDASNARTLTTNNNANINVAGTLIIWGNVTVNNSINWSISGTVIVKGDLIMNNNSNLAVSGNLQIDGNLNAGTNTNVNVSGTVAVGGTTTVGNGSNLNGCAGCFQSGGDCSGPSSFCGSGALPVTLLSFTAKPSKDIIVLEWKTTTELNSEKFVIERSDNGIAFESINEVQAAGNSVAPIQYTANDNLPLSGRNYYRLKTVDLDGYFEYSDVVTLNYEGKKGILIYPTPSNGEGFKLLKNFHFADKATIQIVDNLGIKVRELQLTDLDKEIQFREPLQSGAYLMKVVSGDFVTTIRFSVGR
jgi:hypothetical protein